MVFIPGLSLPLTNRKVIFLHVVVKIKKKRLSTDLYSKPLGSHVTLTTILVMQNIYKNLSFTVKP